MLQVCIRLYIRRVSGIMNKSISDVVPSVSMSEANNINDNPLATSVGSTALLDDKLAVSCSSSSFGPGEEMQSEIKWIIVNNCVYAGISIIIKPPINMGWVTDVGQQLQQPVLIQTQRGGPIKILVGPRVNNPENTMCTPLPSAQRKRPNKVPSSSPVFKRPRAHPPVGRDCAVNSVARALTCAVPAECSVLLNEEMREKEMTVMIVNESDESRTISSYGVQPDRSKTVPLNTSDSMDRSGDVPKEILTAHVLNCDLATFVSTAIGERDERSKKKFDRCSISSQTKLQKTTGRVPGQSREQPFSKEKTLGLTSVHRKKSQVKREHFIVVADSNKNSPPADVGSSSSLVINLSLADISSLSADSTTLSADPNLPLTDTSSLSPVISSTPSDTNSSSTILRLPSTDPTSPHIIVISLPSDLEKLRSYLYDINLSPTITSLPPPDFSSLRDDKLPSGIDINTPSIDVNSTSVDANSRPVSTAIGIQSVAEWFSKWTDIDNDQSEERPIDKDDTVGGASTDIGEPAAAYILSSESKRLAKVRHESYAEEHIYSKRICSPVPVVFDNTPVDSIGVEQKKDLLTYDCGVPANNKVPKEDDDDDRYSVEWVGLDDLRKVFGESIDVERSETPKQPVKVQRNNGNNHVNGRISNKQRISENGYITSDMRVSGKSCISDKEHIPDQECVSRNIQISSTDCVVSKDCSTSTSHVVTEEQQRIVYSNRVITDECISGNSQVSVNERISEHVYATSAEYTSGTGSVFSDMRISDNDSVANKECTPFERIFVVDKRIPNIDDIAVSNKRRTGKSKVSKNECGFNKKWMSYNSRVFVVDKRISNRSHIADDKCISHNNIVANEKHISSNGRVFVADKLNNDNVAANDQHISVKDPGAFNEERIPDYNHDVINVENNYNSSHVFDDDCLFESNLNGEFTSDAWIEFMEVCQPSHDIFN